jgi:hypothetical protein
MATLPNDSTPSSVEQGDYAVWKANFGRRSSAGQFARMPEPSSISIFLLALFVALVNLKPDRQHFQVPECCLSAFDALTYLGLSPALDHNGNRSGAHSTLFFCDNIRKSMEEK